RVNALRALASFRDSALVGLALPLVTDRDINVAVQAETTLGVLGGARAAAQLRARLSSARFALRRQAAIALAQADSAAGVAAAAELARDRDWRWRGVAAEACGGSPPRSSPMPRRAGDRRPRSRRGGRSTTTAPSCGATSCP